MIYFIHIFSSVIFQVDVSISLSLPCGFPNFTSGNQNTKYMEVITIDSKAFNEIMSKLNNISESLSSKEKPMNEEKEWVDSFEVCSYLHISSRTLQRLRRKGTIKYTPIGGKNYYQISEVRRMLEEKLIRTKKEYLDELILHHKQLPKNEEK